MPLLSYFNSIKVRLEQTFYRQSWRSSSFQFHKGTIRTPCFETGRSSPENFNSIKVRLEPAGLNPYLMMAKFQFHKGKG